MVESPKDWAEAEAKMVSLNLQVLLDMGRGAEVEVSEVDGHPDEPEAHNNENNT